MRLLCVERDPDARESSSMILNEDVWISSDADNGFLSDFTQCASQFILKKDNND